MTVKSMIRITWWLVDQWVLLPLHPEDVIGEGAAVA